MAYMYVGVLCVRMYTHPHTSPYKFKKEDVSDT